MLHLWRTVFLSDQKSTTRFTFQQVLRLRTLQTHRYRHEYYLRIQLHLVTTVLIISSLSIWSTKMVFVDSHLVILSSCSFLSHFGITELKIGSQCVLYSKPLSEPLRGIFECAHAMKACSDILRYIKGSQTLFSSVF